METSPVFWLRLLALMLPHDQGLQSKALLPRADRGSAMQKVHEQGLVGDCTLRCGQPARVPVRRCMGKRSTRRTTHKHKVHTTQHGAHSIERAKHTAHSIEHKKAHGYSRRHTAHSTQRTRQRAKHTEHNTTNTAHNSQTYTTEHNTNATNNNGHGFAHPPAWATHKKLPVKKHTSLIRAAPTLF